MSLDCIILAGGLGTRLKSIMNNKPKCLALINGQPFLKILIESLAKRKINNFILALGFGADDIIELIYEDWAKKYNIKFIIESEQLGTGGSVLNIFKIFNLKESLVVNGDSLLLGNLSNFLSPLNNFAGEYMRIATFKVNDKVRYGSLVVNEAGMIISFNEKNINGVGLINGGLYYIDSFALKDFKSDKKNVSMEKEIIPYLIINNMLFSQELPGPFIDIGLPDDYFYLNKHLYLFS
jgi:D-glycero-alpha-D-manno-heptose 1-phosphate guanylyltransferase